MNNIEKLNGLIEKLDGITLRYGLDFDGLDEDEVNYFRLKRCSIKAEIFELFISSEANKILEYTLFFLQELESQYDGAYDFDFHADLTYKIKKYLEQFKEIEENEEHKRLERTY